MHFQILSIIVSLSLVIQAFPSPIAMEDVIQQSGNSSGVVILDESAMHENVLSSWSPDRITTSEHLNEYLQTHHDDLLLAGEEPIYLSDTKTWITLDQNPAAAAGNTSVEARQTQTCSPYFKRTILYTRVYWAPWHSISSCIKSDANPSGGAITVATSDSVSVAFSGGLNVAGFAGAISAAVGWTVEFSYSTSQGVECSVRENDAVQVWARHRQAWAYVNDQYCQNCNGYISCGSGTLGYINTAGAWWETDKHQFGCSAKSKSYLTGC